MESKHPPRPSVVRGASLLACRPTATLLEAVVVLGLPLGAFFAGRGRGLWLLLTKGEPVPRPRFGDAGLLTTLVGEVVLSVGLLWWLARRDWRPAAEFGRPTLGDALRGAVLWVATFAVVRCFNLAAAVVAPGLYHSAHDAPLQGGLSLWVALAALAINPVFEEVLWLGYAIPTLSRTAGLWVAALASVALRLAVHYNQGAHAVTSILPVALVWTGYFVWRGRLWPVVIAHVINNAFGLGEFVGAGR